MQIKYTFLLIFLFVSAMTDVLTNKIKNIIILTGLIFGLVFFFSGDSVKGFFLTFLLFYPIYRIGWCGAGDVKLMMLAGYYLGIFELFSCTVTILALSMIFAAACALAEKRPVLEVEIPYAVPVFLGVILHALECFS